MKKEYKNILLSIEKEEINVSRSKDSAINEAHHMISFLRKLLTDLKTEILLKGFESVADEICFFKHVKPEILGRLIYYNKILKIETLSPTNSEYHACFYTGQLKLLNKEYKKYISNSEFYKYYRSGRTDRDETYFRLGNINVFDGLDSFFFEVDPDFSTFYDFKIARVIGFDLLHTYLSSHGARPEIENSDSLELNEDAQFSWTDSKNALIELIYALHISRSVSNGKAGLRKISQMFEDIFEVSLGDIHHAFHQMKFRAGQKARYLHFLRNSLEQYMDKEF
ncbi:RteC protein [Sphingobacterium sp. Ag1]|uniref:RteC domain-containing protein n=1 Tax=Sphingobacterium sp. Ag1 TaxID=1643451 RepID=UPI000627CFFE|nr:RteC domain-containing protein [Sphingobacterium sp. Ag1]KKO89132.1 RteC protein [Sphingobacterium sp. Ag1]